MTTRFCGQCGREAAIDDRFCTSCGHPCAAVEAEHAPPVGAAADGRNPLKAAVALLAAGHNEAAAAALEELVRGAPAWAAARSYLGIAYLRCTRVAEARRELEEALETAPRSFICLTKYAEFLARLGFYDQALERLDAALMGDAPDGLRASRQSELARFCKERVKGIYYRQTASPRRFRVRNLLPGGTASPYPRAPANRNDSMETLLFVPPSLAASSSRSAGQRPCARPPSRAPSSARCPSPSVSGSSTTVAGLFDRRAPAPWRPHRLIHRASSWCSPGTPSRSNVPVRYRFTTQGVALGRVLFRPLERIPGLPQHRKGPRPRRQGRQRRVPRPRRRERSRPTA